MNQEIKDKLEQAAEAFAAFDTTVHSVTGNFDVAKRGYSAACKDILENPGEWGLVDAETNSSVVKRNFARTKEINQLQSQLTKYKEALESIRDSWDWDELREIAKEALKQEKK